MAKKASPKKAAAKSAPAAPANTATIVIVDKNRQNPSRHQIPNVDAGSFRVNIAGAWYERVGTVDGLDHYVKI